MSEEVIFQEHTYEIAKQSDVGFGIAISGGRDNPAVTTGDPAIIISDVVKHGPAFNRLQINDTVTRVNDQICYGWAHQQAVRELKNSGKKVKITVKRKAIVRVESRDTPSPGPLHRSRSRNLDNISYGRHRSRSRDRSPRRRHRSHSRDLDSSSRNRRRSRGRGTSRSRSRGRSYSRSRSRSSRHSRNYRSPSSSSRSRSRTPPRRRSQSRGRSRSKSPPRSRHRSDSRERSRSLTPSSRSASPIPMKHKSVGDLRSMSPLSPDPPNTVHGDDMMVFPVKPSENRAVVLKKTRWNNSYGLKLGTRIYIQDIQPGSLADKNPELKAGDTIMMINGRNVDNKTVNEAIQIIGLSKDKLTMLVKKEEGGTVSIPAARLASPTTEKRPTKPPPDDKSSSRHSSPSRSSVHSERSRKSGRSIDKHADTPQREPKAEKKPDKKTVGGVLVMPAGLAEAAAAKPRKDRRSVSSHSSKSSSRHSGTPEPAPRVKAVQPVYDIPPGSDDEELNILPANAHTVKFVKGRNVGIRLAGGNDVGIFVASVQEGSPAAQQGLKMGDQILSVNDQNFRNIIREEAVLALMGLPDGQEVSIVAQPKPDVYQKILEHGTGDSFYIRTHFKYERANEHEMSFKQGSVFRISDTLYQGMVGYWLAVRIGRSNMEIERGVIPNGSRAQQLKEVQDKKIQQSKDKASQRGGIKRRLKGNQGKGKNDKQQPSNSPHFPAYERVVLREAGFKRPVVVFGPLADIARQRLASDYPPSYDIANNDGTVSGQKSNRKGIIRLNTIKDIIEKDKHAILDITPTAVEKLNYAQLYPIVVFLKPTSKAAVKELRSKLAVTEEEKRKKPGKLYDRAIKMQKGYSHVATDSIPLGTVSDDWYRKLHSTIKDQQNMPVWVSEDKLGATAEEDTEGVLVPGDDDRLSYVSAPASDYSVTTVGSEMLHSTAEYDDMDEPSDRVGKTSPPVGAALMPPGRRRKSSSSSSSSEDEAGNKFDDDDLDDALKDDMDDGPPATKPLPPDTHGGSHSPLPEAPPRGRKHTNQKEDDASSTSSEERIPVGGLATPLATMKTREQPPSHTQSRPVAPQSMPQGRFDPDSFLKSHIKRLNKVRTDDAPKPAPVSQRPPEPVAQPPRVTEPPLAAVAAAYNRSAPPPKETSPVEPKSSNYPTSQPYSSNRPEPTPAPGEPVYAQVNKNSQARDSAGGDRDYSGEIDSFIQTDPYRSGIPQRKDPPMGDTGPRQPYNRFAGANKPIQLQKNQFSSYGGNKPTGYHGPSSNVPPPTSSIERPQKSQFVQDKYKNYVSQIRQSDNKPSGYDAYNPRPYNKSTENRPGPPSGYKNGPTKDQMYDSGVDTYDKPKFSQPERAPVGPPPNENNEDPQVVATARGMFDSDGGVLSSVETGVSIMIPKGAIPAGVKQEIYFKVCKDNTVLPPLDKDKGETLLSPLVMCGPHGLQFNHPVELRLPHCASLTPDGWSFSLKSSDSSTPGEPSQWQNMNMPSDSNYQVSSNSVSVLIDHF
ncbi:tight junction protein ZO-1-like isoform X2 [Styela clava]